MKKISLVIIATVLAIALVSCKSNDTIDVDKENQHINQDINENSTSSNEEVKNVLPVIENKRIYAEYKNLVDNDLIIEINFPNIENESDKESFKKINEALDKYAEILESDASWFTEEFKTDSNTYPDALSYKLSYDISLLNTKYLSISFTSDSYFGGAHPDSVPTAKTFDLQTGKEIALDKIFSISEDEYKKLILDYIYKQTEEKYKDEEDVAENLDTEMLMDALRPDSFYVTDKSLVIIYYSYDFLCYAVGNQEFYIPFEELTDKLLFNFNE